MNNKTCFFKPAKARFVLNTVLLIALTGCVSYAEGQSVRITVVPPVVVAQDNFVYYPNYAVYYNTSRHQCFYLDGAAWVSRPAPPGVSVNVLLASPSVRMDFHDSPANHHAAMAQKYPKNYKAARSEEKAARRDEHGRK